MDRIYIFIAIDFLLAAIAGGLMAYAGKIRARREQDQGHPHQPPSQF